MKTELQGQLTTLKPFTEEDVTDEYVGWLHDPDVTEFLEITRTERSKEALQLYTRNAEKDPDRYFYSLLANDINEAVGTISVRHNKMHATATYGFIIGDKDYWGTDVALDAQKTVFNFAFEELKIRKLSAGVCLKNLPSHFNLRRLGFEKEGVLRADVLLGEGGDIVSDVVRYGMLYDKWLDTRDGIHVFRK
ncbi:MAG: GNAT family N-acetyltransferase [Alphaproteobacteria bacterium]|jgi:[ribosomal protein S5]-alanine N-acetyltransferase|nr:GNAT family N-acetyltransferase [Alphaproteobacteria bacterium]